MVHSRKKKREYSDKEIIRWLTDEYPPTNVVVLSRVVSETKNPTLKKGLKEWIKVVEGKQAFMGTEVFDKIVKMKEVE